jgi:Ca-activated chloride channel family protein
MRGLALITLFFFVLLLARANSPAPQQKPSPQPSPTPPSQLLDVQPPLIKVDSPPGQNSPTPNSQRKPGEIDEKHPLITNTDLISLKVTVTDKYGRFVSGLSKKNFTVFDDEREQEITYFSDEDAPISIGIVFDATGSMSGGKIGLAISALKHFIDSSHPQDEYFLIDLQNGRANLLEDRTRDGQAILNRLIFIKTKGSTAFYDGVYLAAERVTRGTYPKRAVIVISDGQDNSSRYTFNNLRDALKESDVMIYSIGIEESGFGPLVAGGSATLDQLSNLTGGKAFYPQGGAEMDDIFEQIALDLRHQYSIAFRPSNFALDGKWHKLTVKVNAPRGMPRLWVRTKAGYFAVANPQ